MTDSAFQPSSTRLLHAWRRARLGLGYREQQRLRQLDLLPFDHAVLIDVRPHPGVTGNELARHLAITPQDVANLLAKPTRRGLLDRAPHATHRPTVKYCEEAFGFTPRWGRADGDRDRMKTGEVVLHFAGLGTNASGPPAVEVGCPRAGDFSEAVVGVRIRLLGDERRGCVRTIGLLGGMSWESTAEYYRLANQMVASRLGGFHSARILLHSLDFADIEQLQADGDWVAAGVLLARSARALQDAGAHVLVLCTNTMHIVADEVQAAVSVPLLHLADTAATAVASAGLQTVALLGTAFTMERPFYRDRLQSHGLRVIVPGEEDRATVHRIIYDELVHGVEREESRQAYRDVITRLVEEGAEGVILGCTEIELLITAADCGVPIFPTTQLHVAAAVEFALQD